MPGTSTPHRIWRPSGYATARIRRGSFCILLSRAVRGRFALPERVQLFRRTSISGDKPDGGGCTCEVKVAAGSWKVSGAPLANRVAAGGDRLNDNDTRFNL